MAMSRNVFRKRRLRVWLILLCNAMHRVRFPSNPPVKFFDIVSRFSACFPSPKSPSDCRLSESDQFPPQRPVFSVCRNSGWSVSTAFIDAVCLSTIWFRKMNSFFVSRCIPTSSSPSRSTSQSPAGMFPRICPRHGRHATARLRTAVWLPCVHRRFLWVIRVLTGRRRGGLTFPGLRGDFPGGVEYPQDTYMLFFGYIDDDEREVRHHKLTLILQPPGLYPSQRVFLQDTRHARQTVVCGYGNLIPGFPVQVQEDVFPVPLCALFPFNPDRHSLPRMACCFSVFILFSISSWPIYSPSPAS